MTPCEARTGEARPEMHRAIVETRSHGRVNSGARTLYFAVVVRPRRVSPIMRQTLMRMRFMCPTRTYCSRRRLVHVVILHQVSPHNTRCSFCVEVCYLLLVTSYSCWPKFAILFCHTSAPSFLASFMGTLSRGMPTSFTFECGGMSTNRMIPPS